VNDARAMIFPSELSNPNADVSEKACGIALSRMRGLVPKGAKFCHLGAKIREVLLWIELGSNRFILFAFVTENGRSRVKKNALHNANKGPSVRART
jgi:hypothetical protein